MRRVLAVVGDLHCGSTVGLCGPEPVDMPDGQQYLPSTLQGWLYKGWRKFWDRVAVVRATADRFGILTTGDLVDGDHHGTTQILSRDLNVQSWVLREMFKPVLALQPDFGILVRGTETHVGANGATEESFARWLHKEKVRIVKEEPTRMFSHWHFKGLIGKVVLDVAHHGRIGGRPWTKHGAVAALAAQIVIEAANQGTAIPDLAIRAHFHTFVDSGAAHRTRLIATPCFMMHTAHSHRVVPEVLPDIGGLIVTIEDGKPIEVEPVLHTPERRKLVQVA